jgi:hypothetical protein|eukprot:COSAG06_NODE_746_length_12649_cov_7.098327_5_plen_62_part_00
MRVNCIMTMDPKLEASAASGFMLRTVSYACMMMAMKILMSTKTISSDDNQNKDSAIRGPAE